jgi:ketosteroid isomerase-like protein
MTDNAALIRGFYDSFQHRDHEGMARCYAMDARFRDPVFTDLNGWRIGAMWRMLCERAADLRLAATNITADADRGAAHWEATYTFSATGRTVHNVIDAQFIFANGKIMDHTDRFDLWRWSRQALGAKGMLLGWSPPVQNAIRAQAARGLEAFIAKNYPPRAKRPKGNTA